jgi:hypothetical protein
MVSPRNPRQRQSFTKRRLVDLIIANVDHFVPDPEHDLAAWFALRNIVTGKRLIR